MSETLSTNFSLNQKVICDGFIGTIRYIGPLHDPKSNNDTWIGIEWDDDFRGKNNGSVNGTY